MTCYYINNQKIISIHLISEFFISSFRIFLLMEPKQSQAEILQFIATHPGSLIADELETRENLNQKELAHLLGVKVSFLNEIIKGKRTITADTALLLEKALDIPADFWMKFQTQYDLDTARIKQKNILKVQKIEIWSIIKDFVSVLFFKKLGYLTDDIEKNISKIFEIFKIDSVDALINQFAERKFSLYRKSQKLMVDEKNLFSWSVLAEYKALQVEVKHFQNIDDQYLIAELNRCFYDNKNLIENVTKILKTNGIKFFVLEQFTKTPVDGYSFWSVNNPAIVMSCRYNRVDNFAFTLFHELGHIFLHLNGNKDLKFLDIDENEKTVFEIEADSFARNKLINKEQWKKIEENKFPIEDIKLIELSNELKVHPYIIFARIGFEAKNYKVFTKIERAIN